MEFVIGAIIGTGIGFLLSHISDNKDRRIKFYRKVLKIRDDTIETLSIEKAMLQDEVLELKQFRDAINDMNQIKEMETEK